MLGGMSAQLKFLWLLGQERVTEEAWRPSELRFSLKMLSEFWLLAQHIFRGLPGRPGAQFLAGNSQGSADQLCRVL